MCDVLICKGCAGKLFANGLVYVQITGIWPINDLIVKLSIASLLSPRQPLCFLQLQSADAGQ